MCRWVSLNFRSVQSCAKSLDIPTHRLCPFQPSLDGSDNVEQIRLDLEARDNDQPAQNRIDILHLSSSRKTVLSGSSETPTCTCLSEPSRLGWKGQSR
jgi:hypothetical protein